MGNTLSAKGYRHAYSSVSDPRSSSCHSGNHEQERLYAVHMEGQDHTSVSIEMQDDVLASAIYGLRHISTNGTLKSDFCGKDSYTRSTLASYTTRKGANCNVDLGAAVPCLDSCSQRDQLVPSSQSLLPTGHSPLEAVCDAESALHAFERELQMPSGELECIASGFVAFSDYEYIAETLKRMCTSLLHSDTMDTIRDSVLSSAISAYEERGAVIPGETVHVQDADDEQRQNFPLEEAEEQMHGPFLEERLLQLVAENTCNHFALDTLRALCSQSCGEIKDDRSNFLQKYSIYASCILSRRTLSMNDPLTLAGNEHYASRDPVLAYFLIRASISLTDIPLKLRVMSPAWVLEDYLYRLVGVKGKVDMLPVAATADDIHAFVNETIGVSSCYVAKLVEVLPTSIHARLGHNYLSPFVPIISSLVNCGTFTSRKTEFFVSLEDRVKMLAHCDSFRSAEEILLCLTELSNIMSSMISAFSLTAVLSVALQMRHFRERANPHLPQSQRVGDWLMDGKRPFRMDMRDTEEDWEGFALQCCQRYTERIEEYFHPIRRRFPNVFIVYSLIPAKERPSTLSIVGSILVKLLFLFAGGLNSISADDRRHSSAYFNYIKGARCQASAGQSSVSGKSAPGFHFSTFTTDHSVRCKSTTGMPLSVEGEDVISCTDDVALASALQINALGRFTLIGKLMGFDGTTHGQTVLQASICATIWRVCFQYIGVLPHGSKCPRSMLEWINLFPLYALPDADKYTILSVHAVLAVQYTLPLQPIVRENALTSTAVALRRALDELAEGRSPAHTDEFSAPQYDNGYKPKPWMKSCFRWGSRSQMHREDAWMNTETPPSFLICPTFTSIKGSAFCSIEGGKAREALYRLCALDCVAPFLPPLDLTLMVRVRLLKDGVHALPNPTSWTHRLPATGKGKAPLDLYKHKAAAMLMADQPKAHYLDGITPGDELSFVISISPLRTSSSKYWCPPSGQVADDDKKNYRGVKGRTCGMRGRGRKHHYRLVVEAVLRSSIDHNMCVVVFNSGRQWLENATVRGVALRRRGKPLFGQHDDDSYAWTNPQYPFQSSKRVSCLGSEVVPFDTRITGEVPFTVGWLLGNCFANGQRWESPFPPLVFRILSRAIKFNETVGQMVLHAADTSLLCPSLVSSVVRAAFNDPVGTASTYDSPHRPSGGGTTKCRPFRPLFDALLWNIGCEKHSRAFWSELVRGVRATSSITTPLFSNCCSRTLCSLMCGHTSIRGFSFTRYFDFSLDASTGCRDYHLELVSLTMECLDKHFNFYEKLLLLRFMTGRTVLPPITKPAAVRLVFPSEDALTAQDCDRALARVPTSCLDNNVLVVPNYMSFFLLSSVSPYVRQRLRVGTARLTSLETPICPLDYARAWAFLSDTEKETVRRCYRTVLSLRLQQAIMGHSSLNSMQGMPTEKASVSSASGTIAALSASNSPSVNVLHTPVNPPTGSRCLSVPRVTDDNVVGALCADRLPHSFASEHLHHAGRKNLDASLDSGLSLVALPRQLHRERLLSAPRDSGLAEGGESNVVSSDVSRGYQSRLCRVLMSRNSRQLATEAADRYDPTDVPTTFI